MAYPPISSLPTPPSRQEPATFSDRGDAFLGALPTFGTQVNAAGDFIDEVGAQVTADKVAAAASASAASTSETNAAASAAAAASDAATVDVFSDLFLGSKASDPFVDNDGDPLQTGAIYYNTTSNQLKVYDGDAWQIAVFNVDADGALLAINNLSDLNNVTLARQNLGVEIGVDVQAFDTNIVTTTATQTLTNKNIIRDVEIIAVNTSADASVLYVITADLTLTLPATPTVGSQVHFSNRSGLTTPIIARNGSNIMGVAEDLTLDDINAFGALVFADATRGWIFQ